jgi:hypothetical protein
VQQCVVRPSGTSLRIEVRAQRSSRLTPLDIGASFLIEIDPVEEMVQGTAAEPIELACSADMHIGAVGTTGESFYAVTGLKPDTMYFVEIADLEAPYDLTVVDDESRLAAPGGPCATGRASQPARCKQGPSTLGTLYVRVRSDVPLPFTLRVAAAAGGSEGSFEEPFTISRDQMPYIGRVGAQTDSYYAITGLIEGASYVLYVVTEQEVVQLNLWSGRFAGSPLLGIATPPGTPTAMTFVAPGNTAYFTVNLLPEADGVTSFSFAITPS